MTAEPLTKVFIIAHVPAALQRALLQHIRDFDVANPGCHFEMAGEPPSMSVAEAVQMIKLNPELTFSQVFKRGKE